MWKVHDGADSPTCAQSHRLWSSRLGGLGAMAHKSNPYKKAGLGWCGDVHLA